MITPSPLSAIQSKLQTAFSPSYLSVEDESHLHAGHGGAAEHKAEFGDTPSHVHIAITAERFETIGRLARHRAVMDIIAEEVAKLHALRLTINPE